MKNESGRKGRVSCTGEEGKMQRYGPRVDPHCKLLSYLDPDFRRYVVDFFGGADRDRFTDLLIAKMLRDEFSYTKQSTSKWKQSTEILI